MNFSKFVPLGLTWILIALHLKTKIASKDHADLSRKPRKIGKTVVEFLNSELN